MAVSYLIRGDQDFFTKITGVTFEDPISKKNRQEIIKKHVQPGMKLKLKREPNVIDNSDVIAVRLEKSGFFRKKVFHLGYLNEQRSKDIIKNVERGYSIYAKVANITGGVKGKPTLGVNIEVRVVPK
jgi:hypothetical protein